jgi:HPt (histidine-containing phosphotransfer) domain-containing protein
MATEFDYAQLDSISGGDAEFEREVLEEYMSSAPGDMARLRAAIEAGDAAGTCSIAHALKGSSATLGAKGFAATGLVIEQAGKKGEIATALRTIDRFEAELGEVIELMRLRLAKAA